MPRWRSAGKDTVVTRLRVCEWFTVRGNCGVESTKVSRMARCADRSPMGAWGRPLVMLSGERMSS